MDRLYRVYRVVVSWSFGHRALEVIMALLVLAGSAALLSLMDQSFILAINMQES